MRGGGGAFRSVEAGVRGEVKKGGRLRRWGGG